jgi:uncharacterized delta-60 repeat protein
MRWTGYLLSRLFLWRTFSSGSRKPRPVSRRVWPTVEMLEDRLTPSSLQVSLSPHTIVEAPGASATTVGTVTRVNTDNTLPMAVSLTSSNNAEVTFPASVVIPAGQASTTFNVTAVTDSTPDGTQNVTITGTARVPAPTALDPTFGGTGSVAQSYLPFADAIQPDGKIVIAGTRYNGGGPNYWDFAVSRYNADGSLDTTFGGTGTVYTDLSGQSDQPHSVVIQADGKIVVGGIGGNGPHFFWELARYNTDGSLDPSFGNGGVVLTNPNPSGYYNEIWDLALQPDGKILAAGDMDVGSDGEFAVARYNANGTLDTTFGSGGIAASNPRVGYSDRAFAVVVQPADGKIILAGGSGGGNFDSHFAVSRFTPAGVLDPTFGGTGTIVTDIPGSYEEAQDAVLQPDGKLVVVGYVSPAGVYPTVNNFALVRYNANGSLDTSFGYQGFVITDFGGNDSAERVALQPDGRIEVVGSGVGTTLSTSRTIVAWYTPSGALGGYLAGPNAGVLGEDVALQPDGGVVAVSQQGTQFGGYVERYVDSTPIAGSDTVAVQDPTGPLAFDDAYVATENTPLTVSAPGVLANDTDSSGAPLTAIQLSNPTNGTATLNGDGSFTYTPNTGFFGTDSFTYKANDGTQDSNTATVTITVTAPAPTANDDSYSVNENTTLNVAAPGVLANDTDPDNNPLSAVLVTKPGHGTATLNADGSLTYKPSTYFYGADSFTYEAYNGSTYSSPATVSINVNHVNQPPLAVNDSYTLNENSSLSIQKPGVLANDTDPDNDPLTAVLYAGPAGTGPFHGTLTFNPDGSFVYTPNANFSGTDSFTYRAFDGSLYSNVATAKFTVNTVPPTANNDAYSVNENSTLTVAAPGVLANDTPTTSDALSASVVSNPAHGTVTLNVNGSFTYTPNANFSGTDSFTYHDVESGLTSNTATVTITVNFVDRPPVAVNDVYTVNEDSALNVTVPTGGTTSLYLNSQPGDYIGQGQTNTWTTATGAFTVNRNFDNGVSFSYQDVNPSVWWYLDFAAPNKATLTPGYYGNAARFPFQDPSQPGLSVDGEGRGSNTLTGNFTVTQAAYDPSGQVLAFDATFEQHSEGAKPALFGEIKYHASTIPLGVLANDSDPDGQAITAVLVNGPSHGSLTLNSDGTFGYKPNEDFVGTDSFTYVANDGTLNSNTATATITVNPVNEAPSFVKGADQTIVEGAGPQTVAGWATSISAGPPNESNQTLNFLVNTNNNALFSVAPAIDPTTGTLTYTPAPGVLGSATVTVQLHDNGGTANGGVDTSAPQTFTITINDATPTFTLTGAASVDEGSPYTLNMAANDPDAVTGWTVTWGDGVVQTVSGNPSSLTHVYPYGANNDTISATATDEDGTHAAANTVAVSVVPVHLGITAPAGATAGAAFGVTVAALDANGNPDTTYSGTVQFTSSDGLAALPADYTFVAGDAGSHAFSGVIFDTAGAQTLTATDTTRGTITGGATTTVSAAAAARFAVSAPTSAMAGVAFSETVIALDAFGNVATGYTGTVHFTSSDAQAGLPADAPLTNGTGLFNITLKTAGVQSVTAADTANSAVTGALTGISVAPAAAARLSVSGPTTDTAGGTLTFAVTALDAFNNTATGYAGTVHFTSSDGQATLPADYTFGTSDQGTQSFSVVLRTAGVQSVTATDAASASITGTQGGINVSPATAATLSVSGFPSPTTAGAAGTFTVTLRDAYGNVATAYAGTVHFTSSDGQAALPSDYQFRPSDAGIYTFSATLKTAGVQSITATDAGAASLTGTDGNIAVAPAAAATMTVAGFPSATTAGATHAVTVTVRDAFGNVATGYAGTVHFTSSDAQAGLPADHMFTAGDAGVHSFNVILKTSGTQSITTTDLAATSLTATQGGIAVSAAAAAAFSVTGYPAATAGTAHTFTVTARDAFGNVATGYTGTVHFTSSDAQAVLPANYTFGAGDAGVHAFSATLKTSGAQSLTATDVATTAITGTQSSILISAAAATHFRISAPANVKAGTAFSITVTALDAFGNVATGYRGSVHFTSSDKKAILPSNYTFVSGDNGVHTFTVTLKSGGTRSITATDTANASITGGTIVVVV